jgi:hypothetical protein
LLLETRVSLISLEKTFHGRVKIRFAHSDVIASS